MTLESFHMDVYSTVVSDKLIMCLSVKFNDLFNFICIANKFTISHGPYFIILLFFFIFHIQSDSWGLLLPTTEYGRHDRSKNLVTNKNIVSTLFVNISSNIFLYLSFVVFEKIIIFFNF